MTQMSMGSNIPLAATNLRATLRWSAGPGVPDVDASALLLEDTGEVGSDADFVFYNQPTHYTGACRLAGKQAGPDSAQNIDVDLSRVPDDYQRIVIAASADGGTFGQVPDLQLVLSDLAGGQPLALFPMQAATETAFVCAEIYRRDAGWKFRAVGQGYSSGLAGLASDFGIDVGESDSAAAASSAPSAPPAAPAPPPPAPSLDLPPTAPPPAPPLDLPPPAPPVAPPLAEPPAAAVAAPPAPEFAGASLDLSAPQAPATPSPPPAAPAAPPPPAPPLAPPPPPPAPLATQPPPPAPPVAPPPPPAAQPAPPVAPAPPPVETAQPAGMPTYEYQAPPEPPAATVAAPPVEDASPVAAAPPPTVATGPVTLQRNQPHILGAGSEPLNRVVFSLGWSPAEGQVDVDLDASVIAFDANAEKLAIVWYMHSNDFYGALQHTGDNRQGGTSGEQVLVDLGRLPMNVHSLIFTINSFRKHNFTDIASAYCWVTNGDTNDPLARFDLTETQPSTAVLMAELRRGDQPGTWHVRGIGEFHDYRTVKKLVPAAARQVRIGG
jgi:stress response protein SCP2